MHKKSSLSGETTAQPVTVDPRTLTNLGYSYLNKKNQNETKQKFKLIKTTRRRAQKRARYVAPGTNCSPSSYVVNAVQMQSSIVIMKLFNFAFSFFLAFPGERYNGNLLAAGERWRSIHASLNQGIICSKKKSLGLLQHRFEQECSRRVTAFLNHDFE